MGERTAVVIEIGGKIPESAFAALAEAIQEQGFGLDWDCPPGDPATTEGELREAIEPGKPITVMDNETYADLGPIAAVCADHGLFWRMCWDAYAGAYEAGGELHDAEGDTQYSTNGTDGEPYLSAQEIRALGSVEAITARLARLERALPPFEIVADA